MAIDNAKQRFQQNQRKDAEQMLKAEARINDKARGVSQTNILPAGPGHLRRKSSNPTLYAIRSRSKLIRSTAMAALLPFFLLLLLAASPSLAREPHVITISTPDLHPTSLAWDPTAQHFLIASLHRPTISSVSDAGVVSPLLSAPSHIAAIAIDDARRRLLVALAHPAALAAYDLRSPLPHTQLFLSSLPDGDTAVPGGVAIDPATGDTFVTAGTTIYKIDVNGVAVVLSQSKIFAQAVDGVAYVRNGYLLAVQAGSKRLFKVDAEDGATREVIGSATEAETIAVASYGSVVVAGGAMVRMVKSQDGWGESGIYDEMKVGEGWVVKGVAVREGRKVFVLMVPRAEGEEKGSGRIEEVEWEREKEGDMVWGMVLLGLGFAYFLYWRFQMGKLAGTMNKKRV